MFRAESTVARAALIPLGHGIIDTGSIVLESYEFFVERGIRPVHILKRAVFRAGLLQKHLPVLFIHGCIDHFFAFRTQRFCLRGITLT